MRYTVKGNEMDEHEVCFGDECVNILDDEDVANQMAHILNKHLDIVLNAQPKVRETKLTREEIALAVLPETVRRHTSGDVFYSQGAVHHAFLVADEFIAYRDKDE